MNYNLQKTIRRVKELIYLDREDREDRKFLQKKIILNKIKHLNK